METRRAADDLTVVVIGLNAASTLEGSLASVRRATAALGPGVRVLYVDGGSRDASVEIARRAGVEVIELHTDHPTAAKGRNAGWRAATTRLVQFVDSDSTLEPDWLVRAIPAIDADPRIASLFGQLQELNPTGSIYNEACGCDWYVPPGEWRYCGGNALFRLDALREVDGSDEALAAGEEVDLCRRLRHRGWRIVCVEYLMAHHDLGMGTFRAYWRRAIRSGEAYAEVALRYARTDEPIWRREFLRNLLVPPAALVVAAALLALVGPLALAAAVGLVALRLVAKFFQLRKQLPGARLRALYIAHLTFVRLPLFVGSVQHLLRRASLRRGEA